MIDKDTKLFVSVSSHPGNFGASLYNAAFEHLGYNAIYKPLKCETISQFVDIVRYAKNYSIEGISVSMPFKKVAVNLGTLGDGRVGLIGNANTLVFDENPAPKAYNTDCVGFEKSAFWLLAQTKNAVIFGKGAVAESIANSLNVFNVSYMMTKDPKDLTEEVDLFVNATPIGMEHIPDTIFTKKLVQKYKYIFDVVCKKETNLTKTAKNLNKPYVNGISMSLHQLIHQFQLYTHLEAPRQVFETVMKERDYI